MTSLSIAVRNIFKGAAKSFYRFPVAILSAIIVSIATVIKISMQWEVQRKYNLLFDSIQISFILSAVFSMVTVILSEIKPDKRKSFFTLANILSILVGLISFLLLYFLGGKVAEDKTVYLSSIAMARVTVAIFISIVAFIYTISKTKAIDSFSDSLFITHRAFIISAIYGIVIMIGVSGVLGAFLALVYRGMDYRVYQYLGVVVGFVTYAMFLGYFPSFKKGLDDLEIKTVKEQPRFIFVLLDYILVPIMLALTIVLLIWSATTILGGVDLSFNRLSGISSSYVIIGIWLHIMVSKHETKLAQIYKRVYPFAGILILAFEAWALFVQLNKLGLRTAEYSFVMIWVFGLISLLLLVFLKNRAYRKIAITAITVSIIWVLPIVGYQDITFNSQVKSLEKNLIEQKILVNNKLEAKDEDIEYVKRGQITEAVDFISNSDKTNTPSWFKKNLNDEKVFKDTFGFEKVYNAYSEPSDNDTVNFILKQEAIDISDYSLSLNIDNYKGESQINTYTFEGKSGSYDIIISNDYLETPKITVKLEDGIVIEENLNKYLEDLAMKYPLGENDYIEVPFEDMSLILEVEDASIIIVFNNIESFLDGEKGKTAYYLNPQSVYIKYK